ncbi:MAG: hypothetical protein GY809_20445, partial [Planctomycetes bacterium]|nr:hypothetical protein [Planctomycetota bacterium]
KANQAWLVCPPETIQAYSYVFTQGDREPVRVNINDPTRAHRSERQGITYYSVIHRLAATADKIVFTASRQEEDHLVLSFVLPTRMMMVAGNGNGVPGSEWQGCFSTYLDRGTLRLDPTRWIPVRIESRACVETYHDYVTMGQGGYAPLRIQIDPGGYKQFDWRFKLHEPGLWLLDEARFRASIQDPKKTVAVVHDVKVNGTTASASGDISDQGLIRGHVRDLQGDPVVHAVVMICEAQGGIPLVQETRRPISQAYLNEETARELDFAVTDESGAFQFSQLPEGTYRLVAQSWEGQTHITSPLDKNSRTIHLHGVAEFVRPGQKVDIRPLGTGTLSMDRGDATIVTFSTRPTRADPIMMFTGWGGEFMKNMVGGAHLLSGRNTITGLTQGTVHLAMFANDNAPAWAEAQVDIRPGQTTHLDAVTFVGTWSNCRYDPPAEIQPCFDMLKQLPKDQLQALVSSVSSQTGLDLQSARSKGLWYYMALAAPHLYKQVTLPNGQTVTVREFLSSLGYVELQTIVARKWQKKSDRVAVSKDARVKDQAGSESMPPKDPVQSFAWQRTDTYLPPNPDAFFPNDRDGGKALDLLFDAVDKDKRSDEEILSTVRQGFRRTSKHKTLVLRWIGNKYIWGKDPQHAEAIEIMYHAVPMERHYAVYYGLSTVRDKSEAVIEQLINMALADHENNLYGRIIWGLRGADSNLIQNALLRRIPKHSDSLHDKGSFYVLYQQLLEEEPPATLNWDEVKQTYPDMLWVIEYTSIDKSGHAETLWNTVKAVLPHEIWIKQMPSMRQRNAGMLLVRSEADSKAVISAIESMDTLKVGHASAMSGAMLLYFEELNRPMRSAVPAKPAGGNVVQELIDKAKPGETVIVPNGTYTDPIRINKPLTLQGESRDGCLFEVKANHAAIHVDSVTGGPVRIERMTVAWQMMSLPRRTDRSPFAIWIVNSRAVVQDCRVRPITPGTSLAPVALRADGAQPVTVQNCRFDGFEYTVCFGKASQGRVTDCLVLDGGHQGITGYDDSRLAVERTLVSGFEYHGIRCTGGTLTVTDCLIADVQRCGIYLGNKNSQGRISNCVFLRDSSGVAGYYLSRYD